MASCLVSNPLTHVLSNFKSKEDASETESTISASDASTAQASLDALNNNDLAHDNLKTEDITSEDKAAQNSTNRSHTIWKAAICTFGILLLFCGRFGIPNNDVDNLTDNVLDYLIPINNWIHANKDTLGPKLLLFCCATNMDLVFFVTMFFWFKHGKTGRLPYSIAIFYLIRTAVQQMSFQPFPKGYYWDSPGFPSFVAPYGRSTDFFFSGHSGFLVLMQNEWGANGYKKVQRYIQANLIYTIFVLLVCQAHYSIDIFTGVFFADYVFGKVNEHKDKIDEFFLASAKMIENLAKKLFSKKTEKKKE